MSFEELLFPHLVWAFAHQEEVGWIYLMLMAALVTRVWLTVRVLRLPRSARRAFIEKTFTLSEATANIALLFGVLGTLVGVTFAVTGRSGNVDPNELLAVFSSAFGIAISTTIAGGLTYTACSLLSALDGFLVEEEG